MEFKNIEDVLLKKPFRRVLPNPISYAMFDSSTPKKTTVPENSSIYKNINQDDFLREYFPTGHQILNPAYYPNRLKVSEDGNTYIHYVERFTAAWQQVITKKHLTHLCGNPIDFVNSDPKLAQSQKETFIQFKQGWIDKNMEVAWYEAAKSAKITGDCAISFFMDKGVLGWRLFSYLNDETLYPHYNSRTGKLAQFARRYKQYDPEDNSLVEEYVDVYDDKWVSTYRRELSGGMVMQTLRKVFGKSGWSLISREPHGFDEVPVAYKRCEEGACWSSVQDSIDKYEKAVSQLLENNQSYAFRMLFLKGESVEIKYDALGQPTAIVGDKDSNANFLDKADASTTFELSLKILLQNILSGAFIVLPPEVKAGSNMAGVTIKIMYSPAVENGMFDAKDFDPFIDDMVRLFKYGYGIEMGAASGFEALKVRGKIKVYVHQNDAEFIQNINASVASKSLSKETASEIHPYATSDEISRITKETEKEESSGEVSIPLNPDREGMNDTNRMRQINAELQ